MKHFSTSEDASSAQPDLAVRLRQCATILTRAACLVAADHEVVAFYDHKCQPWHSKASGLTLAGLIRHARKQLFPHDPASHADNAHHDDRAFYLAVFLTDQEKPNQNPGAAALIAAANRCREWAAFQEAVTPWALADHYEPYRDGDGWAYRTAYRVFDGFRSEEGAEIHASRTREEDELARETASRIHGKEVVA